MKIINGLRCWLLGHRRGKRISPTHVECPRCSAQWERKGKAKA